ncbi:hypothetical protein D6827_02920 [Candidatus Parcubacteria bacterium]|nr:MAG: hypothetical protein D6827_02920 [Candidatus Parcubacteria bacterium]
MEAQFRLPSGVLIEVEFDIGYGNFEIMDAHILEPRYRESIWLDANKRTERKIMVYGADAMIRVIRDHYEYEREKEKASYEAHHG